MKRLALSLVGGFAITIFYITALLLLWYSTRNHANREHTIAFQAC